MPLPTLIPLREHLPLPALPLASDEATGVLQNSRHHVHMSLPSLNTLFTDPLCLMVARGGTMVLDICSPLLEARPCLHDLCIPIAVTGVWRTAGV